MTRSTSSSYPFFSRLFLALFAPLSVATFVSRFALWPQFFTPQQIFLGTLGVVTFLVGLRWYSPAQLGMRTGRPMLAGVGFGFLVWVSFLLARFIAVELGDIGQKLGITFLFLLIFQGVCVQIWSFGLLFPLFSERFDPVIAAFFSALSFAYLAQNYFSEGRMGVAAFLYFFLWGAVYAIIRLRTGSWLGILLAQTMQTLTAWFMLPPGATISYNYLYGIAAFFYLILIWRLWPRSADDLRV